VLLTFFISAYTRDRTVFDSLGRAITTDVLPEIPVVKVPSAVKKHYQLLTESLLERSKQPNPLL